MEVQRGIGGSHALLPRQYPNTTSPSPAPSHSRLNGTSNSSIDQSSRQQRPTLAASKKLDRDTSNLNTSRTELETGGPPSASSESAGVYEPSARGFPTKQYEQPTHSGASGTRQRLSTGKIGHIDSNRMTVMDKFPPILEESIQTPSPHIDHLRMSPMLSRSHTASTESNQTVKGSVLALSPGQYHGSTPSYPFPPMGFRVGTPVGTPAIHKPFTALSPTGDPPSVRRLEERISRDMLPPEQLTPARDFIPVNDPFARGPTSDTGPNMYNIVLGLMSETSLDSWWTQLTRCLKESYAAERVILAVPSDITDVENVPWAQFATYNAREEESWSKETMNKLSTQSSTYGKGSQEDTVRTNGFEQSSSTTQVGSIGLARNDPLVGRPKPELRHSFHGFPQNVRVDLADTLEKSSNRLRRPKALRSGSYSILRNSQPVQEPLLRNSELRADPLKSHEDYERLKSPISEDPYTSIATASGRILDVVQPLEAEVDPILTSAGVIKVLDRINAVVLTREHLDTSHPVEQKGSPSRPADDDKRTNWMYGEQLSVNASGIHKTRKEPRSEGRTMDQSQSKMVKSLSDTSQPRKESNNLHPTLFEDYEQIPASPWSQSPAPSPAVQADPDLNPFFVDVNIDENAFAENPPLHNYTTENTIQAIGVDRASSIIHIPLVHPTMSQLRHPAHLRTAKPNRYHAPSNESQFLIKASAYGIRTSLASSESERRVPIAILSILSPTAPYPSELTTSLNSLAPMVATSFYNVRQLWNAQKEIMGLSRQRNTTAVRPESYGTRRAKATLKEANIASFHENEPDFPSVDTGSGTSASEYSGVSIHSPRQSLNPGSIAGTPTWDPQVSGSKIDFSRGHSPSVSRELIASSRDDYFENILQFSTGSRQTVSSSELSGPDLFAASKSSVADGNDTPTPVRENFLESWQNEVLRPTRVEEGSEAEDVRKKTSGESTIKLDDFHHFNPKVIETAPMTLLFPPRIESSTKRDDSLLHTNDDRSRSPRNLASLHASMHGTERKHRLLHSNGAKFSATNPSLPHATTIVPFPRSDTEPPLNKYHSFKDPTPTMLRLMIDNGATQQFIAESETGAIVWANSKFQSYRSESTEEIHQDPWNNIHYKDQKPFRKLWKKALRTGDQLSHQVRLRRFDGQYRWFHMRILPLKDKHTVIKHWHGQAMDVHDLHVAELEATREKEKAASEYKYRSLANSNPHIIFAASVPMGMTFANNQWLSYSGQSLEETLGFGFLEHVHPDDLVKCRFPDLASHADSSALHDILSPKGSLLRHSSQSVMSEKSAQSAATDKTLKAKTTSKSIPTSVEAPNGLLRDLVKAGVIKCSKDGQGNITIATEMRLRSKHNEYRWHLIQGSLIDSVNFGQGDAQWFIACADITDQKHSEAQLKEACDTLEKEMTRKMDYLSSMSHEIRTPLNGILGNLQFLTNSGLDEFQSDWTFGAQKAAEGMHMLINDILDLSKAEAKMLKLFYDWFSVRAIIEEVIETLNAKAGEKFLELCYEVSEIVPSLVKGDAGRIRQILLNLVGNAIKFTQKGEIWIKCDVKDGRFVNAPKPELAWNEVYLRFSVRDTGSGFTDEEKKMLFKPYSQIDNSNTRDNGGTGLGLILCKNMVELHGGKIEATSVPGKGSTFTFFARFTVRESISQSVLSSSSTSGEPFPLSPGNLFQGQVLQGKLTESPGPSFRSTGMNLDSPSLLSSGSSNPSIGSFSVGSRSHRPSIRSSTSTIDVEASQLNMKLSLPLRDDCRIIEALEATDISGASESANDNRSLSTISAIQHTAVRPQVLSVLIVCPQENTRRTTQEHIQRILPKSTPATISTQGNVEEIQAMIGGDNLCAFSHIVLQLSSATEVLGFMDQILNSSLYPQTCLIIVTDQTQKAIITSSVVSYDLDRLVDDKRVRYLMKPAKPHKFARIFDPDQENAQSNDDRTRVEVREKQRLLKVAFKLFKEVLGNKGLRVLAVEDNNLNMEVCTSTFSTLALGQTDVYTDAYTLSG